MTTRSDKKARADIFLKKSLTDGGWAARPHPLASSWSKRSLPVPVNTVFLTESLDIVVVILWHFFDNGG
jgi:hypothetical protein